MNRSDISKKDVALQVKHLKKTRKEEPISFNRGHFPPGTVAVFESPRLKFLAEEDRVYPGQRYETFTTTVLGVKSNGHDSYVAVIDQHCPLINGPDSINISWAREILKRGKGDVNLHFNPRGEESVPQLNLRDPHPYDHDLRKSYNKHPSKYYIQDLRTFILFTLNEDIRYKDRNGDHLYNLDQITRVVAGHPTLIAASTGHKWFTTWTVSKKKFHKILRAAVNKGRTSRIWAQAEDYLADQMMYEEEAMRELEMMDEEWERFNNDVADGDISMSDHPDDDARAFSTPAIDHVEPIDLDETEANNLEEKPKSLGQLIREYTAMENVEEDTVVSRRSTRIHDPAEAAMAEQEAQEGFPHDDGSDR